MHLIPRANGSQEILIPDRLTSPVLVIKKSRSKGQDRVVGMIFLGSE